MQIFLNWKVGKILLSETIKRLNVFLKQYDKVILLTEPYFSLNIETDFIMPKSVLILSEKPLVQNVKNVSFLSLPQEKLDKIAGLYHTYEFSDCFKVISASPNSLGGILNLRSLGILNDKDVFNIIMS